jgi:flavorubredoxin
MTTIHEIAADLYRLSIHVPEFDMQFNHFLVRDEEPLLFHAGCRRMFPALHEALATLIVPASLRHIAWSHFEADECGALNEWLAIAPQAQPVCTLVGKLVSADDFADRPAFGMGPADVLSTGRHRFRFLPTPHLPHGWDAGLLFEETGRTLFCSDLLHHFGDGPALSSSDLIGPATAAIEQMQQGPMAGYLPYTPHTDAALHSLAQLRPRTLAVMHGSSFSGEGDRLLTDLAVVLRCHFGQT